MQRSNVRLITQLALFTSIELIFCFTPLGSIPITAGIVATLSHIPALVAAVALGPKAGAYTGAVFGVSSLIVWSLTPPNPAIAFVFSPFYTLGETKGNVMSLVICLVPRILFPLVTAFFYRWLKQCWKLPLAAGFSAALGTLAHTVMVLGLIYLSFHNHTMVGNAVIPFLIAWAGVNAILEMITAAVVTGALAIPLARINR